MRVAALIVSLVVLCVSPRGTHAQDSSGASPDGAHTAQDHHHVGKDREEPRTRRLAWNPAWGEKLWPELTVGTVFFIPGLAMRRTVEGPPQPRWRGANRLDRWVQDGIGRKKHRHLKLERASDGMWFIVEFWAAAVDGLLVTWIGDRNTDVALHLLAMDLQGLALAGFVNSATQPLVARERPYADCTPERYCHPGAQKSFPSGHTALAFAGASLMCVQHHYLPLYGGGWADPFACGVAISTASTVAVTRLVLDRHWMTDVLAGVGIGVLFGGVVPWLQHFRHGPRLDRRSAWLLQPWLSQRSGGVTFSARH